MRNKHRTRKTKMSMEDRNFNPLLILEFKGRIGTILSLTFVLF